MGKKQGEKRITGKVGRLTKDEENIAERRVEGKRDAREKGGQDKERDNEEIRVRKIGFWNVAGVNKDGDFWRGIAE